MDTRLKFHIPQVGDQVWVVEEAESLEVVEVLVWESQPQEEVLD